MKLVFFAVAAALTMAFSSKHDKSLLAGTQVIGKKAKAMQAVWPWYWYNYIGEPNDYFHQFDESYYELDDDQYPQSMNMIGYIRAEVKCMGDAWIEGRPDFTTIQAIRYRPM